MARLTRSTYREEALVRSSLVVSDDRLVLTHYVDEFCRVLPVYYQFSSGRPRLLEGDVNIRAQMGALHKDAFYSFVATVYFDRIKGMTVDLSVRLLVPNKNLVDLSVLELDSFYFADSLDATTSYIKEQVIDLIGVYSDGDNLSIVNRWLGI